MHLRNVTLAALAFATVAFAQDPVFVNAALGTDSSFQVHYAANLNIGESYVDITNTGANGAAPLGPGYGPQSGNLCVNVYAFDPGEELISCCSCFVTPDQTVSLGVNASLTSNTATGVKPNSVTIKILANLAGPTGAGTSASCQNSAATPGDLVSYGVAAWGTTLHATPTSGTYATTETPFTPSTLSSAEYESITGRCSSIIGNDSGFGICASCQSGAQTATRL